MFGFGYNKEKSRANAEKYLQQNKLSNAIAEYEKILKEEPRDLAILNTVGDVYARMGQNEKAIDRFKAVGEAYATDGFVLKAIAVYKKITKLDPHGLPSIEKLAELYRKQGMVTDARSALLQAADGYSRKGQNGQTLRLLKQLVLFDPENVQVITRTADLMSQGGEPEQARQMLMQTATTLVERHAFDSAQKILERLLQVDRNNTHALELRAQVTYELGDYPKAIELYEALPDLDSRPDALRTLLGAHLHQGNLDEASMLARKLVSVHQDADGILRLADRLYKENDTLRMLELYSEFFDQALSANREEVIGHLEGAVSRVRNNCEALQTVYKLLRRSGERSMIGEVLELLAHAAVQANQLESARDAYKELIELEPDNNAHVQGYRQVCALMGPGATTPAPSATPGAADEPRTLADYVLAEGPDLPAQNYPPEVEEEIQAALTEAELCESFSNKTKGIAALESALGLAPEDLRLNRALAVTYAQVGQKALATRCYASMHRVLEAMGESEAASFYCELAGAGQTTTWEAKTGEFTPSEFEMKPEASPQGTAEEIDLSGEWESVWQVEEPKPEAAPAIPAGVNIDDMLVEARFCLDRRIISEAESLLARIASYVPDHPELPALRARLQEVTNAPQAAAPAVPPAAYQPVEVIEVGTPSSAALPVPPPPPQPAAAPTLNSLAAELDAELGEGFEPAPRTPVSPRPTVPPPPPVPASTPPPTFAPPAAAQAPAAWDPNQAPQYAPPQPPAYPPQPNYAAPQGYPQAPPPQGYPGYPPQYPPAYPPQPNYAAPQANPPQPNYPAPVPEPAAEPSVFGNLLQDFERELEDTAETGGEDPESHFNLGIAFREMALLDEAIGEFQKVCRLDVRRLGSSRAQQAYIWLATCFVEKGVPEAAINWYQRALEIAPNEESRVAVTYELASAYEAAGRKREALERFMEVYGTNIDYRDVAGRIRELRASVPV